MTGRPVLKNEHRACDCLGLEWGYLLSSNHWKWPWLTFGHSVLPPPSMRLYQEVYDFPDQPGLSAQGKSGEREVGGPCRDRSDRLHGAQAQGWARSSGTAQWTREWSIRETASPGHPSTTNKSSPFRKLPYPPKAVISNTATPFSCRPAVDGPGGRKDDSD
jgi:hypothetical protein